MMMENKRYGELMVDTHWMDKWLKEVLMTDELCIVETDKVNHTMETDKVRQIVDVESSGKSADEIDKETMSFGEMQLKQEDRSCVHASIELHLHAVHVIPRHFSRECRSGRSQGRRSYGDNGRSNAPTNESSSQALVAQDSLGGYDWSNDFEEEPVKYALIAISSSSSSSSSDSEVQKCSKQCLESFKCLQKNYDTEREKHNKAKLEIRGYEIAESTDESRIVKALEIKELRKLSRSKKLDEKGHAELKSVDFGFQANGLNHSHPFFVFNLQPMGLQGIAKVALEACEVGLRDGDGFVLGLQGVQG
ncbi:hypothetical protein Tco_0892232 [Tanacetum coccineum]|uniref:DUSP domain-containing protein n=1 Tax=Tanacetum coccineum TaxID=301880 RepID=A0ABQ5C5P4_9ASTR